MYCFVSLARWSCSMQSPLRSSSLARHRARAWQGLSWELGGQGVQRSPGHRDCCPVAQARPCRSAGHRDACPFAQARRQADPASTEMAVQGRRLSRRCRLCAKGAHDRTLGASVLACMEPKECMTELLELNLFLPLSNVRPIGVVPHRRMDFQANCRVVEKVVHPAATKLGRG